GTATATTRPSCGSYSSRPITTAKQVSSAATNRPSTSTNQPIFSTSPLLTATTSPAAIRRVSSEPSSAALRISSCCRRDAVLIQLVTTALWKYESAPALAAPKASRRAPASISLGQDRSIAA